MPVMVRIASVAETENPLWQEKNPLRLQANRDTNLLPLNLHRFATGLGMLCVALWTHPAIPVLLGAAVAAKVLFARSHRQRGRRRW